VATSYLSLQQQGGKPALSSIFHSFRLYHPLSERASDWRQWPRI